MADNMTTGDEMDSSYGAVTPPEKAAEPKGESQSVDEANAGASEVLIAKDKLPTGIKEGDTCTFKVTKDFGDELSLEYVKETNEEQTETETPEATTESEIAALDRKE